MSARQLIRNRWPLLSSLVALSLLVPAVATAQTIPETPGILTTIMNQFLGQFSAGYGHLLPWATRFLFLVSAIEIIWAALYWALEGENFLPQLLQKVMLIGAFAFLVLNWQSLVNTVATGFVSAGALAGGLTGGAAVPDLRDPSQVLNQFWRLAQPISDYTSSLGMFDAGKLILVGFGYIILAIAIFIIAIQCALTYLEFYLVTVIATVLVPFGVNKHLSFLAERSFGAVISHGVKLAVLSFILTAAAGVLSNIATPTAAGVTYALVFNLDAAALLIAFLAWQAPNIAAGLFNGSPSLHAGQITRSLGVTAFTLAHLSGARSGGAVQTSSIQQIAAAARATGRGISSSVQGLTRTSGAVVGAARGGAAVATLAGGGRVAAIGGALAGVNRLGLAVGGELVGRAAGALSTRAHAATAALRQSWESGQVVGYQRAWGVPPATPPTAPQPSQTPSNNGPTSSEQGTIRP